MKPDYNFLVLFWLAFGAYFIFIFYQMIKNRKINKHLSEENIRLKQLNPELFKREQAKKLAEKE